MMEHPKNKCHTNGMCTPLISRLVIEGAGFCALHTTTLKDFPEADSFLGVVYKYDSEDKGLMLNFCPFCRGEPGYFKRDESWMPGETQDSTELLARLESAEADAARYRWLRSRVPGGTYRVMGIIYSEGGEGVDEEIDAARAVENFHGIIESKK